MAPSDPSRDPFRGFRVEVDPERVEEAVTRLREAFDDARQRVEDGVESGRYTKVRISYKGQQVGPEVPLSAFLAGQGLAFLAMGPLYALLGNLGAKAVLEVEFLHDSDELIVKGNKAYMESEVEVAESHYREALRKRPNDPTALYHLGVVLRVTGRQDESLRCFRQAALGPEGHPDVIRAAEMIDRLSGKRRL
jgi:tetratricopeptide (TPR) repeat protein